jgi:DNA-binding CsgD family transcriptional regulator
MMACHKLIPIFADGQIQFGVCLITCSTIGKADKNSLENPSNLKIYYKENKNFDEYSFKNYKWKTYEIKHLTKSEKIILILAINGESNKSLAERLCISYDNLQHRLTKLYRKLDVKTMRQALFYSINHSLLFSYSDNAISKTERRKTKKNKRRNKLVPEVLQNIQTDLNNKQTVRSIAKRVGVSESAIRKAIKLRKLTIK